MKTIQEILKPIQADFEEWFENTICRCINVSFLKIEGNWKLKDVMECFYDFMVDFQIGVLLRYFREQWGIVIELSKDPDGWDFYWMIYVNQQVTKSKENDYYMKDKPIDFNAAFYEVLKKAVELIK